MELLAVLGQYLLLSFVLPGFCYVAIVALWLPAAEYESLKGIWVQAGIIGGLLLSSVAFAIEVSLRHFITIDCEWIPRIAFERIHDMGSVVNFFAGETFMHWNIGIGTLVIFVIFFIYTTKKGAWRQKVGVYRIHSLLFALALLVIVAANITISAYLFRRVDDIAFNVRDEVAEGVGSGSAAYCICLRTSAGAEKNKKCRPLSSSPEPTL